MQIEEKPSSLQHEDDDEKTNNSNYNYSHCFTHGIILHMLAPTILLLLLLLGIVNKGKTIEVRRQMDSPDRNLLVSIPLREG